MRKTLLCLLVMLCLASAAFGADITGAWNGIIVDATSGNKDSALFTLKQEGEKVTGTAGPNATEQFPVSGTVKGDEILLEVQAGEGRFITVALKITGDQMTGRMEMRRNGQIAGGANITLKREAAKTQN